jgi:hypothetical protein
VADLPVLSAGPTPRVSLDEWTFSVDGEIDLRGTRCLEFVAPA